MFGILGFRIQRLWISRASGLGCGVQSAGFGIGGPGLNFASLNHSESSAAYVV